jgi:hypothetical protein
VAFIYFTLRLLNVAVLMAWRQIDDLYLLCGEGSRVV